MFHKHHLRQNRIGMFVINVGDKLPLWTKEYSYRFSSTEKLFRCKLQILAFSKYWLAIIKMNLKREIEYIC